MATGTSTRRTTAGSTSSISMRSRAISPKCVLFRRLLEGEHLVAWVEVHDLAVLDHPREMLAALQNGDVGDRILVHDDDVGELARRELAQLAFETDGVGIVAGGGDDGLEWRVAAVLNEDFELLGVQLAVACEGIVAGVGSDEELDAELARLVHQLAQEVEVPLHARDVELHLLGADLLAELDHDRQERGGGNDRHAALGHRLEVAVGGEIGVDDPVDAGLGRGARRAGAAGVNADTQIAPVRLADHGGDLVLRQHLRLARAAVRHLDEVDAVLALPPHLGDHLVGGVAELADGMIRCALPRRLIVLDAAVGDDHAAGDEHARTFHQAELDGVANADVGKPGAAGHRDAGDPGAQHLLYAACGFQRGEFRPGRALAFALALDRRVAVGDVAVRIDQPRHDPLSAGVDHLDVAAILELHVGRQRAHALDAIALDYDGVVARRGVAGAVDQGAVADHQRLLARGAHAAPPVAGLADGDVTSKPAGM